jgi:vacuolar protein sorting-associated protein 54
VAPTLQQIVNVLVESAIRDPRELVLTSAPTVTVEALQNSANDSLPSPPPVPPPKSNGASSSAKQLRIEDGYYFTVSATSAVLFLLSDYLKVIVNLSMLTMDTMSKVIEFLKAFNSRTCQVVLGAGAMRSAGLKNITAKHLCQRPSYSTIIAAANVTPSSLPFSLSFGIAVFIDHDRADTICTRDIQETFKLTTSCDPG